MERREGWLGYVAVALGALALLVALFGNGGGARVELALPATGYLPEVVPALPPLPAATVVPPAPPAMERAPLPGAVLPPELEALRDAERRESEMFRERMYGRKDPSPAEPFSTGDEIWPHRYDSWHELWGPQAIVTRGVKLVIAIAAIGLGVWLLRGRRGGQGHTPPPAGPPSMV